MRLFLTIESQIGAEKLGDILRDVTEELKFVTEGDVGLEDVDNYGTEFRLFCVIPTCLDDDFWRASGWKERKLIWRKRRETDIRLRMDFYRFVKETPENQRLMFIDIIVKSIQVVQERSKGDFRGNELIRDILSTLNVTEEQLKQLNEV